MDNPEFAGRFFDSNQIHLSFLLGSSHKVGFISSHLDEFWGTIKSPHADSAQMKVSHTGGSPYRSQVQPKLGFKSHSLYNTVSIYSQEYLYSLPSVLSMYLIMVRVSLVSFLFLDRKYSPISKNISIQNLKHPTVCEVG